MEATLLRALHDDPADDTAWLALADALEEGGQPDRAELLRLALGLRTSGGKGRAAREARLRELLAGGVKPCVPVLTNSVGMGLALIPAGSFLMGERPRVEDPYDNEGPRHRVTLTRPFYLGVHPVTQAQYQAVTRANPSQFRAGGRNGGAVKGLDTTAFPVENVSWDMAASFCKKLSARREEKAAGRVYRLPTEAEWEYACRAGTTSLFQLGDTLSSGQANFDGQYPSGKGPKGPYLERPTPVGSYPPNAWGLFDLHGNVWEWCHDWYGEHYYRRAPATDPPGKASGEQRVQRGGAWFNSRRACRTARRRGTRPRERDDQVGFRVALDVRPAQGGGP